MEKYEVTRTIQLQGSGAVQAYKNLHEINKEYPFDVLGTPFEQVKYFTAPLDIPALGLCYKGLSFVVVSSKEIGKQIEVPDVNKADFQYYKIGEYIERKTPKVSKFIDTYNVPPLDVLALEMAKMVAKAAGGNEGYVKFWENFVKDWREIGKEIPDK